jgi:hypothetical protein
LYTWVRQYRRILACGQAQLAYVRQRVGIHQEPLRCMKSVASWAALKKICIREARSDGPDRLSGATSTMRSVFIDRARKYNP